MIEIETKYIPWEDEIKNFVGDLTKRLNDHLPPKFSTKIDERVKGIVLGTMPPYMGDDVGAYNHPNKKIYLSDGLLYERDPKEIAEVLFHEFGHPLLNDEFNNIDSQISADFLAIYSVGSCDVFKERKNKSMRYYTVFEKVLKDMLGDNEKFLEENKKIIKTTKKEWYPRLREEIMNIFEVNPEKLLIEESVRKVLEKVYPEYKEIIEKHKNDDNPIRNFYRVRMFEAMEKILTTPVKELSGYSFLYIPYEFAKKIEEITGIYIGYGGLMTPKNDIPYTLEEIIERGLKFDSEDTVVW